MCYSQTTSIVSYSIGMLSAVFAFYTEQYILGMLILFYCQIQLSELLIWRGIDTNNTELNKLGTKYGKYLLPTHNIAIGLGVILTIFVSQRSLELKDFLPLVIGIMFYMYVIFFKYSSKDAEATYPIKSCVDKSCQNDANRLQWPYPYMWYGSGFIISLVFLCVYIKPIKSKVFMAVFFVLTLAIFIIRNPRSYGTLWCFSSAILAPLLVIGNYYIFASPTV
jgi:hypothetical protein